MIVVLHIIVLCRFTLRSYASDVLPVSYAWSTFTGPVSGEVHEVQPWKEGSSQSSSYSEYGESHGGPDYVAKPDYSFSYGVDDPNTGDSHGHSETREGSLVTGEYTVMEPGGVLRRVLYTSDPKHGFRASVRYVQPDGGETSGHDHGTRGDHRDAVDHHERFPGPPSAPPYTSERPPSDDHRGPYAPQSPSPSAFPHGDGYDYGVDGGNVGAGGDDDGTGRDAADLPSPSAFKFPSPSGPFFKGSAAADTDSGDYDGNSENYDHWSNAFGSPPPPSPSSSTPYGQTPSPYAGHTPSPYAGQPPSPYAGHTPSPFGQPSSPSPSFGLGPRPSSRPSPSGILSRRLPSTTPPPACAPAPKPSSSSSMLANIVASYQTTGQLNGGRGRLVESSAKKVNDKNGNEDDDDDDDAEPYRSLAAEFVMDDAADDDDDDDDRRGDLEHHEADDDDDDGDDSAVDVTDRKPKTLRPSSKRKKSPSSSSSAPPTQRPRSTSGAAVSSSPSTAATALADQPPSPTMTDYGPTIIEIATSTRYGLYNNH